MPFRKLFLVIIGAVFVVSACGDDRIIAPGNGGDKCIDYANFLHWELVFRASPIGSASSSVPGTYAVATRRLFSAERSRVRLAFP
jgi:hypothetical protein